jgi:hypothetical protein
VPQNLGGLDCEAVGQRVGEDSFSDDRVSLAKVFVSGEHKQHHPVRGCEAGGYDEPVGQFKSLQCRRWHFSQDVDLQGVVDPKGEKGAALQGHSSPIVSNKCPHPTDI